MKTAILFLFICLGFTPPAHEPIYECTNGTISFLSWAPMETIGATSTHLISSMDTATNEIAYAIAISSFQFRNTRMQEDFNENFMESDKYPDAIYTGKIKNKIPWGKDGKYEVISTGKLTIHNISHERSDTAVAVIQHGEISLQGHFKLIVSDYGVKIPPILSRNISEEIYILFGCNYKPVNKQLSKTLR
jgi:hypothetical protein